MMNKILHVDVGEAQALALKKTTDPCKYEIFDPNISDDDENIQDKKYSKSIFDKMQIINGVQNNDIQQKKKTQIILSATKGIHEKFTCQSAKNPCIHKKNITLEQIDEFFTFKKNLPTAEEDYVEINEQQALQINSGVNLPQLQNNHQKNEQQQEQYQQISDNCNCKSKQKKLAILSWEEFQHPYKHLIFSKKFEEGKFKRHLSLVYRGVIYSKRCLKSPSEKFISNRTVKLIEPESLFLNFIQKLYKVKRMKTLFLDLDETLIHTTQQFKAAEFIVPINNDQGDEIKLGVNVRPYCLQFLKQMSEFFEIYIFTASSFNYAIAISKLLDPKEKYIQGILSRENCMITKNGFFIKDLRVIKNRQISQMIIVDNLVHSFGFQLENGVPIVEWTGQKKDRELEGLKDYLTSLAFVEDVRIINDQFLKVSEMDEYAQDFLGI